MNLKYTKQRLISDIESAYCRIASNTYYNRDVESTIQKMIDEALHEYGRKLCYEIAHAIDRNFYSPEEQEKDLGIR